MKQEDTKKRILEKALELFSVYGYDAVSVAQIADAVGIKAPSLYNHFVGKQAIFDAIVEETTAHYEQDIGRIDIHMQDAEQDTALFRQISEDGLCEKLRQLFLYSLHDKTVSSFRRMLTIEQFRSAELAQLYSQRYADGVTAYHVKIFSGLADAGMIACDDMETLAAMYVAPIVTLVGICDRQPEREQECLRRLDAHVRLFYRTVRATVQNQSRAE